MNIGVVTLYSGPLHLSFQKSSAEESQHRSALHEINLGADSQARSPCCLGIGNQLKAARASTATTITLYMVLRCGPQKLEIQSIDFLKGLEPIIIAVIS